MRRTVVAPPAAAGTVVPVVEGAYPWTNGTEDRTTVVVVHADDRLATAAPFRGLPACTTGIPIMEGISVPRAVVTRRDVGPLDGG